MGQGDPGGQYQGGMKRLIMKLPRRKFLHLAAGAAALPAVSRIARAQTYPSQPVSIIVGLPAGTATDILARLVGQSLSERLGKQFANNSLSKTDRARAAISAPRRSCAHRRTATRCSKSIRGMR